jgi:Predicted ATPase
MLNTPVKNYFNYMVEELINGKSDKMIALRELIDKKNLSLEGFFKISIGICEILKNYDINNIVHLSICPNNIFVDLKTGHIIIDENREEEQYDSIKRTATDYSKYYTSPEVLGVINKEVDYRSNLYSIGVIFYEMLTYRLPEESNFNCEIIYYNKENVSNFPNSISFNNKQIPAQLSNIIMKLLAQNPDQRYKSSWGLKFDLERCYIDWRNYGTIKKFKLGAKDISSKFEMQNKLYGRQHEKNRVLNTYKRVSKGEAELLMILSENGMGRSWFINECLKSIALSGGYYIWYQANDNNMNTPYSTAIALLKHLINKVIIEKDANIEIIKNELKEILGENTKAILDLVPEFKSLVSSDISLKEFSSNENECIFNMLFQKIIAVFCRSNKPLVIFIDDIHNLHSSCLNLIINLAANYENKYLMIILGTKYDEANSVKLKNFHGDFFDYIKKLNMRVTKIQLKPLKIYDIIELVNDTFKCGSEKALALATVIQDKTYGNSLYIEQLIKSFIEKRFITFNSEKLEWTWDIEQIKNENTLNTVVEVLIEKINKLPANTVQLMTFLAVKK